MILTVIVVLVGWVLGTIALLTVPSWGIFRRITLAVLLLVFFAVQTGLLYWHFHETDARALIARWTGKSQTTFVVQRQMMPAAERKLVSRATKFIFACDLPPTQTMAAAEMAAKKDELQSNARALGDLLGFSISLSEIEGADIVFQ